MSKRGMIAIDAGTLFTPSEKIRDARLLIDGHSIVEVGPARSIRIPPDAEHIDVSGSIVTPGFIDPHIHGCGGVDVMDGSYESLNSISRLVVRHGTTSFLPTTVSSPPEILTKAIENLGNLVTSASFQGAQPLGIHLEGPFINVVNRGTHKAMHIRRPDEVLLQKWIDVSKHTIRLLTIAPELDGVDNVVRAAKDAGITLGMGHSNADLEEAHAAAGDGVCYAVHTFNAMRGFAHRDPGIVGAVLSDDRIFAEIIADGIHVDSAIVRVFARAKGKERIVLATDAVSATDMPDGKYVLGTDTINVVNGTCRDVEGRLAGSTLTQEVALKNLVQWTGFALEEALLGLTLNPAQALKLPKKGVLAPGADADIAILDSNFHVIKTFVGGRLAWTS